MDTSEKILLGAKEYLIQHGHSKFSVRSVAKQAGVNHGLVHHYFGSKEGMVLALIDYEDELMRTSSAYGIEESKSPQELLERSQYLLTNPDELKLIYEVMVLSCDMPEAQKKIWEIKRHRMDLFNKLLNLKDPLDSIILVSTISGMMLQSQLEKEFPVKAVLEHLFNIFHDR
jgi:AcrR family transcriptional regulator